MLNSWTFGRKIGAGFAISGVVIVVIAIFGFQSISELIRNEASVEHTRIVRKEVQDLLTLMLNAETGQRGFIITGEEPYLDPYRAALSGIEETFESLRSLTSDNPNQQRRLDSVRPLIDQRLQRLANTIQVRREQGVDAARAIVASDQGKRLMDEIRRIAASMDAEEADLLVQRNTSAEESANTAHQVIIWGGIVGIAAIILIGWYITYSLTQQVGAAVRHVQSSSSELQTAANQQATSARQQSTAMSEITTTISELLATSKQIAESAQRVAQIAEKTASSAKAGMLTLDKGNEAITGIRRQVDLIVNHMLELGKKSQQVGVVLDIVAELAEQTNILAINATIEATGAGEAGRRFAVVAEEIRKLADRVAASTKEIRGLIDDVRGSANTTVMTTEAGSKAVDSGSKRFEEVATAFNQIADLVSTTTEASREIELSTKQQATAVEQVDLAVTNVAQSSKETEVSTAQMLQTAKELSVLSHDLLQIVQRQARA